MVHLTVVPRVHVTNLVEIGLASALETELSIAGLSIDKLKVADLVLGNIQF